MDTAFDDGSWIGEQQSEKLVHGAVHQHILCPHYPGNPVSRPVPYSPMHAPRKNVTTEAMWQTLAKHSSLPIKPPEEGQTPKAELRVPLLWLDPVKTGPISGYVLTACGQFSISKDSVRGAPMYTAWDRRPPKPAMAINLGVRLERVEAERLCELANS